MKKGQISSKQREQREFRNQFRTEAVKLYQDKIGAKRIARQLGTTVKIILSVRSDTQNTRSIGLDARRKNSLRTLRSNGHQACHGKIINGVLSLLKFTADVARAQYQQGIELDR